ncbi:response regulator [bacterium]|nr:response regulator [bacterium]
MSQEFRILIADRNRNICEFLKRELTNEGYLVQLTNNGWQVLRMMFLAPPDLLLLDLDMPYLDGLEILELLENNKKSVPVIIHTLLKEHENHPLIQNTAAFLEKDENDVNTLKSIISEVLRKNYPYRFDS